MTTEIHNIAGNIERSENDHPLHTSWSFWYDKKGKVSDPSEYKSRLHRLGSFDSVEGFWKLYLYLKRPSVLDLNVNLYLFRNTSPDIYPMWESFPRGICIHSISIIDCLI